MFGDSFLSLAEAYSLTQNIKNWNVSSRYTVKEGIQIV